MSVQVPLTVECYRWHQFVIDGQEALNISGLAYWVYPENMLGWIRDVFKDDFHLMRPDRRIPMFIRGKRDARTFRLVWDKYL